MKKSRTNFASPRWASVKILRKGGTSSETRTYCRLSSWGTNVLYRITEIVCGVRLYLETHEFHNYCIMSQVGTYVCLLCVPVCTCVYLCLPVFPSARPSVRSSDHPSVRPSVHPSVLTAACVRLLPTCRTGGRERLD